MSKPKKQKEPPVTEEIKLDLGAGRNPIPGFTSVDLYAPAAIKCDLFQVPWKGHSGNRLWADGSVTEIHASHFVEHIPREKRWPFFGECWRVLREGGIMRIVVPSWKSERSIGDMTHEWPPVSAMAFFYLSQDWREANKLTYGPYNIQCNFAHSAGPTSIDPAFANRSHEAQAFACRHYQEVYGDMWVTLTKLPMKPKSL